MPFCENCGRHVPESEGAICEFCAENESQEGDQVPYSLLLAPPKTLKSKKTLATFLVIAILMGAMLFFFLLGRRIL